MNNTNRKRFYWMEGVTRDEVERSLHDATPSVLRQQRPRRVLVVVAALLVVAVAFTMFITHTKAKSYAEVALSLAWMALYFRLRWSIRHISDAPNELLDERQLALRDAGYTVAYRSLTIAGVLYTILTTAVAPDGLLRELVGEKYWLSLMLSYIFCCASLPAMVIAWQIPSEPKDASA